MTDNQRIMMEHAIGGLPRTKSRNYYCVEVGSHDESEWREVVDRGLAEAGRTINDGGDRYYHVTPRGIEWLQEEAEARAEREGAAPPPHATESAPTTIAGINGRETFMPIVNGVSFRCTHHEEGDGPCGCNVFHKPDPDADNLYQCNGCGAKYTSDDPVENKPRALSLSEFAKTELAAQSAASWDAKKRGRVYMDAEGTALDAPRKECKSIDRAAGEYEDLIRESAPEPAEPVEQVIMSKRLWKAYQQLMIAAVGDYHHEGTSDPLRRCVDVVSDLRKQERPRDVTEILPTSEIATALTRDLEADATNPPTGASELARLMGLEGRVRGIIDELERTGENTAPCDGYHEGYKFACRGAAARLKAALKPAPPPAGEPGVLTAEGMVEKWRRLESDGARVSFGHTQGLSWCAIAETYPVRRKETVFDPDPLVAFSKANAAFEAATAGGEKKEQG